MLQHIESSTVMLQSNHFLNIAIGRDGVAANALAVAWAVSLQEGDSLILPFATYLNQIGIPTLSADVCFHSDVKTASIFTLSLNNHDYGQAKSAGIYASTVSGVGIKDEMNSSFLLNLLNEKKDIAYAHMLQQVNQLVKGRTLVEPSRINAGVLQLDDAYSLAISVKQVMLDEGEDQDVCIGRVLRRGLADIFSVGARPVGFAYHLASRCKDSHDAVLQSQALPVLAHVSELNATESLAVLVVGLMEGRNSISNTLNRPETTLMLIDSAQADIPRHLILSASAIDHNLLMTLAHLCVRSELGINIKLDINMLISSDYIGHVVLEVSNDKLKEMRELLAKQEVVYHQLGRTAKALAIKINNEIELSVSSIRDNWRHILSGMI